MIERIRRVLAHIGAWTDDLLFPENVACLCCEHALGENDTDGLCSGCREALMRLSARQENREKAEEALLPGEIDYIHAAFVYEGPARKLIHRLKYESIRAAAVPLAKQMAFLPSGEEEIIVPVPTDKKRERKRGFNQSMLLAQHIGRELGMQVIPALARVDERRPQTGLAGRERQRNLVGCMEANDAVSGKRVLLVDDVCTTGATLREAARALYASGAKSIGAFAAARAMDIAGEPQDPFSVNPEHKR